MVDAVVDVFVVLRYWLVFGRSDGEDVIGENSGLGVEGAHLEDPRSEEEGKSHHAEGTALWET